MKYLIILTIILCSCVRELPRKDYVDAVKVSGVSDTAFTYEVYTKNGRWFYTPHLYIVGDTLTYHN